MGLSVCSYDFSDRRVLKALAAVAVQSYVTFGTRGLLLLDLYLVLPWLITNLVAGFIAPI
jgi:hypothetical protein